MRINNTRHIIVQSSMYEITNSLRRWFAIDFNSLQFMLITPTISGLYLLLEILLLVDECRHSIRESRSTEIHPRRRRFLWLGYHHLFYILSCKRRPKQHSPCLVAVPSVPVVLSVSVFIIIKNPRRERDGSADKRMKRGICCVGEDSLLSLLVDVGEECHHFSICHVHTRVPYIFTTTVASFLPCRSYMCQQDEEECSCCFSSSGKCVNHYICKKKWEVEVDIERNRLLQRTHKWMSFGEN